MPVESSNHCSVQGMGGIQQRVRTKRPATCKLVVHGFRVKAWNLKGCCSGRFIFLRFLFSWKLICSRQKTKQWAKCSNAPHPALLNLIISSAFAQKDAVHTKVLDGALPPTKQNRNKIHNGQGHYRNYKAQIEKTVAKQWLSTEWTGRALPLMALGNVVVFRQFYEGRGSGWPYPDPWWMAFQWMTHHRST